MAGQPVNQILSRVEIRELTRASNAQGFLSLATTWTLIALAFALVAVWPNALTALVAVIVLGGRQLALAVLAHECAHRSLFGSARLNRVLGRWLIAAPVWVDVERYRSHHLRHHAHAGTEKDPDMGLVAPFPCSRGTLVRKLLRDTSGLAGLRRVVGLVLMDLGFLTYTASTGATWTESDSRPPRKVLTNAARNLGPVVVTNLLLGLALTALGVGYLYILWVVAYLTTFSLFVRIRSMAEHACTHLSANEWLNTRTTHANPLARLTVAPHHVNYHLEHHLLPTVPHYRLAALHRILLDRGCLTDTPIAANYAQVLTKVTG